MKTSKEIANAVRLRMSSEYLTQPARQDCLDAADHIDLLANKLAAAPEYSR